MQNPQGNISKHIKLNIKNIKWKQHVKWTIDHDQVGWSQKCKADITDKNQPM